MEKISVKGSNVDEGVKKRDETTMQAHKNADGLSMDNHFF